MYIIVIANLLCFTETVTIKSFIKINLTHIIRVSELADERSLY